MANDADDVLNSFIIPNRDIHIIEVEGSSNTNGSVTLWLVGGRTGGWKVASGDSVGRNMTLVLRASRPTTWSLRTASLHGTITLLVVSVLLLCSLH